MELIGKIEKILDLQSGESARGPWKKQSFVIETKEQYPKKVCIVCWGEKVDELNSYKEGEDIKVSINLESREYNERWYTDVKAWRLERNIVAAPSQAPPVGETVVQNETGTSNSETFALEGEEDDPLPF